MPEKKASWWTTSLAVKPYELEEKKMLKSVRFLASSPWLSSLVYYYLVIRSNLLSKNQVKISIGLCQSETRLLKLGTEVSEILEGEGVSLERGMQIAFLSYSLPLLLTVPSVTLCSLVKDFLRQTSPCSLEQAGRVSALSSI